MTKRTVLTWPDKRLRRAANDVRIFDDAMLSTLDDMYDTLCCEKGAGLAAPQIDILQRIVMINCNSFKSRSPVPWERDQNIWILVNPKIVSFSDEKIKWVEACLSVPEMQGEVIRHRQITVTHKGIDMSDHEFTVGWPLSGVVQHEYDHLAGILYLDRLRDKHDKTKV